MNRYGEGLTFTASSLIFITDVLRLNNNVGGFTAERKNLFIASDGVDYLEK